MKKSMIAMLSGVILGVVLMLGVFSLLNLKPVNENILAQNTSQQGMEEKDTADVVLEELEEDEGILPLGKILPRKKNVLNEVESTEVEEQMEEVQVVQSNATTSKLPYYIKVNRLANCVTIYALDSEGNHTVPIKAMTCSVGLTGETPLGVSKISDKYVWRLLFGNTYGHYSVRFNGHILFHSVPYTSPKNYCLKEGQFNMLGEPASQGCIRLCVEDAKWIYDNCVRGTIVEVYDSEDPGPLGKPVMPKIDEDSPFKGWDPTDPHPDNPWLHLN